MPEPSLPVPPDDCPCAGCAALATEVGADPALHAMLRKKLLIRGWAGWTSPAEKASQRAHATSPAQRAARVRSGEAFREAKNTALTSMSAGETPEHAQSPMVAPAPPSGAG